VSILLQLAGTVALIACFVRSLETDGEGWMGLGIVLFLALWSVGQIIRQGDMP